MLLPNGANAIVDIRKLHDYCLNPDNPRGSTKARLSAAVGLFCAAVLFVSVLLMTYGLDLSPGFF